MTRSVASVDADALHRSVDEHHAFVYRVACRVLGNPADAEDVVQTVFLSLIRRQVELPPADGQRAWYARVTLNAAINHLRGEKNRRKREESWASQRSEARNEEQVMDGSELIATAVEELPARYRLPVILHYQEGLKYREVAEAMGCPEGTIAKRLSVAKKKLRDRLGGHPAVLAIGFDRALAAPPPIEVPTALATSLHRWVDEHFAPPASPSPANSSAMASSVVRRAVVWTAAALIAVTSVFVVPGLIGSGSRDDSERIARAPREASPREPEPPESSADPIAARAPGASDVDTTAQPAGSASSSTAEVTAPAVSGRITDGNGDPIRGAEVALLVAGEQEPRIRVSTNGYGEYTISRIPEEQPSKEPAAPGRVTDGDRSGPISLGGAPIVRRRSPVSDDESGLERTFAPAGANGRIGDGGLVRRVPGFSIEAAAAGFVDGRSGSFAEVPGETVRVDLELASASRIAGRVMDRHGVPVAAAEVSVVGELGLARSREVVTTDDSGRFAFERLASGVYFLRARAGGFADDVAVAATGDRDVVIPLERAALLELHVVDERGSPRRDVEVEIHRESRRLAYGLTDADGFASFDRLEAGSAHLQLVVAGMPLLSESLLLESGVLLNRHLTLPQGGRVEVALEGFESATPPTSLEIRLTRTVEGEASRPLLDKSAQFDPELGVFVSDHLAPGRYRVEASRRTDFVSRNLLAAAEVDVAIDTDARVVLDARDRPRVKVVVTVVDGDGQPVKTGYVRFDGVAGRAVAGAMLRADGSVELDVLEGTYPLRVMTPRGGAEPRVLDLSDPAQRSPRVVADVLPEATAPTPSPLEKFFPDEPRLFTTQPIRFTHLVEFLELLLPGQVVCEVRSGGDCWVETEGESLPKGLPVWLSRLDLEIAVEGSSLVIRSLR